MEQPNQAPQAAVEVSPTRRAFYIGFINGAMGLIGLALAAPAAVYLLFPPKLRKQAEWVETAALSTIPSGTPTEIAFQRTRVDGWKVTTEKSTAWVVKKPDNEVVAFTPQCTHLACAYHWDEKDSKFFCPCHNSVFAIDGKVVSGPAPRPLDRYQTKLQGNKLLIGELKKSEESQG